MVGSNTSLSGGLVAATTLFFMNFIFKFLNYKFPKLSEYVQGHAIMLIYKGHVIEANLEHAKVGMNELLEAVREHGVKSIDDVDLAILEVDGNISVLSNDFQNKSQTKRHRNRKRTKDVS
ncbi:hypothetical protein WOSG25_090550 [Weissella oryzae SG25]|uniref:YetF C-terminal domain-containing protein n=1 Tax=Weissella oryzae (strain DSM 25784 / JCM 18191 / LMG 30913 / SG25) TaxID=1329250 RepID=A0A069CVX5_WEIOS|nr:YetF domain-containing protein [Weissella oryzae]GAK31358.1 hypothetical protein WOSG25_090550 [Weissella oryzae SG25]